MSRHVTLGGASNNVPANGANTRADLNLVPPPSGSIMERFDDHLPVYSEDVLVTVTLTLLFLVPLMLAVVAIRFG